MSNLASILLLIVVLFLSWPLLRATRSVSKHINCARRLNKWAIYSYVGILLLAVVVYVFIPANGDEVIAKREFQALKNENEVFEKAFRSNEESKLDSKFLVEEWTQELESDKLEIIAQSSAFPTAKVNIEWTDSKEQHVEVKIYRTNIIMYGLNLNGEIPLSIIEWEKDQLVITDPAIKEVKYYRFYNGLVGFSITGSLESDKFEDLRGDTYIHLKLPKHINVIDKNGLLIY